MEAFENLEKRVLGALWSDSSSVRGSSMTVSLQIVLRRYCTSNWTLRRMPPSAASDNLMDPHA